MVAAKEKDTGTEPEKFAATSEDTDVEETEVEETEVEDADAEEVDAAAADLDDADANDDDDDDADDKPFKRKRDKGKRRKRPWRQYLRRSALPLLLVASLAVSGFLGWKQWQEDQIKQAGYNVTKVDNLSLPNVSATTVYFGSAAGERETADAIGQLLKAPVAPRTPAIEDQPPGVIVVVAG